MKKKNNRDHVKNIVVNCYSVINNVPNNKELYSIINHKSSHESWRAIVPSIANKLNFGRLTKLIQIKHNTSKTECTCHHIEPTLLKLSVATTPRSSVLMSFLTFSLAIHYNSIIQFSHFTWHRCFTNVSEQYSWYVFRPPLSVLWSTGSVLSYLWSISNFEISMTFGEERFTLLLIHEIRKTQIKKGAECNWYVPYVL